MLGFDTDRIKGYVFATGALRDIRGASALLDRLNRTDMAATVRSVDPEARTIYAHGGSGLFIVGQTQAQAARLAVEALYATRTHSASITGALVPLPPDLSNADAVRDRRQLLAYRLRAAKDRPPPLTTETAHPLLRPCDACGERYASELWKGPEEQPRLLCRACNTKRSEEERVREAIEEWLRDPELRSEDQDPLWKRLLAAFRQHGQSLEQFQSRPRDFDALGKLSRPEGYFGLICADGDGMGQRIEELGTLAEVKRFASVVDHAIYEALIQAATRHLLPAARDNVLPFDVLLLGGDDLVLVTTAQGAIETALALVRLFSEHTRARWGEPLQLSASVVLAHATFPFASLHHLAESGLKFAKKEAAVRRLAGKSLETGLINFLVTPVGGQLDFGEHYKQVLQSHPEGRPSDWLTRTLRPYAPAELDRLLSAARRLANAPRGKLEALREACSQDHVGSRLSALGALQGWRDGESKQVILELMREFGGSWQDFPWYREGKEWRTPLVDLVELWDFIPKEGMRADAGAVG